MLRHNNQQLHTIKNVISLFIKYKKEMITKGNNMKQNV